MNNPRYYACTPWKLQSQTRDKSNSPNQINLQQNQYKTKLIKLASLQAAKASHISKFFKTLTSKIRIHVKLELTCSRIEAGPELVAELVISPENPDPDPLGLTRFVVDGVENGAGDSGDEQNRVERGVHIGLFLAGLADELQQMLHRLHYVLQQHRHLRIEPIAQYKPSPQK